MRGFVFMLLLVVATQAVCVVDVNAEEPTELYDCVDDADGPGFCTRDSTAVLVDEGCGATFNRYHGRIAWPVLRNVGQVTISVKTRVKRFTQDAYLPLYIEVVGRTPGDDLRCRSLAGIVVLVAQGGPDCGGTWESVGPIDLSSFGVPSGAFYHIQTTFFESLPYPGGWVPVHSLGFSCLSVTSHPTAVTPTTWSLMKRLYQ